MILRLERKHYKAGSTIGELYVDDAFECFTLEDGIRTNKVYGETAIPAGVYPLVVDYSPRFKRRLPHLLDVPRFEGIRIHPGNVPANTLGCILVGRHWKTGAEAVTASQLAFKPLLAKLEAALERGEALEAHILQENAPPELASRAPVRKKKSVRVNHASKRKSTKSRNRRKARAPTPARRKTPLRKSRRVTSRR